MTISLNWLKKYVGINVPTDDLIELIGSRLVEVEGVKNIADKYKGIKIVEVVSAEKLQGSDHLTVCQIKTSEKELVQVVCGAPNVRAGMLAVWLPPKTVLPATYDEEPSVLDKRKIMGAESSGMLAAMDELDLGMDHDGIIEIDPAIARPGDDFAEIFGLDDTILDIENKSLTHRPDCFGIVGFARETAGILGQKFVEPELFSLNNKLAHSDQKNLMIEIIDSKLCPRYEAVVLDGFSDRPAKYLTEMSVLLAKSGMRSISPIVDVTNYLMLLSGQPLHAFDYDKLVAVGGEEKPHIIVRGAKRGEKLELLDGKTITMDESDIVITSNNVPIALAGAMGGANTEIDENTKRIVIESATFNLYNLRGTQMRHGIFSEAITRFTKGQPPTLTDPVMHEAIKILTNNYGVKAISEIVDAYPKEIKNQPIKLDVARVNDLLGSDFAFDDIITTLENVGFRVKLAGDSLHVSVPWWRTDIHIAEDVIEEAGRLSGYDNIPLDTPKRGFVAPAIDRLGELKSKIRSILSAAGANEVLTYSFVSEKLLTNVGQDPKNSYKIINSISPELQCVRQSLTPSILEKVWLNVKVPYDHFALFEINQVYQKAYGLTDEKVPVMRDKVALTLCDRKRQGDAYYDALRLVKQLLDRLNIEFDIVSLTDTHASNAPFEPKRSAQIKTLDHKICFGVVGEYRRAVLKNLKLPEYTAGFELNIDKIYENLGRVEAKPVMENATEQDLTFQVGADSIYTDLANLIDQTLQGLSISYDITPVSIYQGDDKSTKNISFRLRFASYDKTLTGKEIAGIINNVTSEIKKKLKGEVV